MLRKRVKSGERARAFWAILGAFLVLGIGCSSGQTRHYSDVDILKVRPASGDTTRILRNASYYQLMGRPESALKELEEAHQMAPHDLKIANHLAETYEKLGRMDLAQKIYLEALAQSPDNQALNNNLCFSYYLAGNWQEAETCFRKNLAQQPANTVARNNLGLLLCRQGRQEEARRLWQEAEGAATAHQKLSQALAFLAMTGPVSVPAAAAASQPAPPVPAPQASVSTAATREPPRPKMLPAPARLSSSPPVHHTAVTPSGALTETKKSPVATSQAAAPAPPENLVAAAAKPTTAAAPPREVEAAAQTPAKPRPPAVAPTPPPASIPKPASRTVSAPTLRPAAQTPRPEMKKAAPKAVAAKLRPLTCEELVDTAIEVRNGNGVPDIARETRSRLSMEGFNVVDIANHIDFGVDRTVIYYRPDAERVARTLRDRFFQGSELEAGGRKLAQDIDVKILLGRDLPRRHAEAEVRGADKPL